VKDFVVRWTKDVIGQEAKTQFDRLVQAGKANLFAGIIAGWESNLSHGYCALSRLGYSAQNLPVDFGHERERVLHRHIERWAKGIYDSGIPSELDFQPYRDPAETGLQQNKCYSIPRGGVNFPDRLRFARFGQRSTAIRHRASAVMGTKGASRRYTKRFELTVAVFGQ